MKRFLIPLAVALLLAYLAYGVLGRGLWIPVSGGEAVRIVEGEREARAFIAEHFLNESSRITRVALVWNRSSGDYLWEVEMVERACGCAKGEEGLNILRALVDHRTGAIVNLSTRAGVKEEAHAKETCMRGCH
ncbi:MAG: hypothetical protein AABX40_06665 [Candidatus Hydrothermarchaeota archaeon]